MCSSIKLQVEYTIIFNVLLKQKDKLYEQDLLMNCLNQFTKMSEYAAAIFYLEEK